MALIQAVNLPYQTPALIATVMALIGIALLVLRRRRIGKWAAAMLIAALVLIIMAAGGIHMATPGDNRVAVLVDESASTRGAAYRDERILQARIHQLLGALPYEVVRFADRDGITELPPLGTGPTLLFSDGQLALPEPIGPVYAVVDPHLASPDDARVVEIRPERGSAIAILENTGRMRQAILDNRPVDLPTGRHRVDLGPAIAAHAAAITAGDRWPENDRASSPAQPPDHLELWNAGLPATPGFRAMSPSALPDDASAYLPCALLALDARLAADLSTAQQTAIIQYVQDLGGSLLLVGADAQWTNLRATALEHFSPLSVDPPLPQAQWIILLDASGSMAQNEGSLIKWQEALRAASALIHAVPEHDPVRLGSFAQDVHWWSSGPAGAVQVAPPSGLTPHGPTNLLPALAAAMDTGTAAQRELLLLTDAEVEIPNVSDWATRMKSAKIRVSCLVLADGRGRSAIETLCRDTGGRMLLESDPRQWAQASRQLAGEVAPPRWKDERLQAQMAWPLPAATLQVNGWNQAWLRQGATAAATGAQQTLAAWWRVGVGQVTALSWWPGEPVIAKAARSTQSKATTDTYRATWPTSDPCAVKATSPEPLILRFAPFGQEAQEAREAREAQEMAMTLIAPSRYQATLPDGWRGGYATILTGKNVVARAALATRYEPEYAHLGTNRKNLQDLTSRSGGQVIEADEHAPLSIRLPMHWLDLSVACGTTALALLAASVLILRRRM